MVETVYLKDAEGPDEDRYLLIQWKRGEGMRTDSNGGQMVQFVPEYMWAYWVSEGPKLAGRNGLSKVYFRGRPNT